MTTAEAEVGTETEAAPRGRQKDRDFTKTNDQHANSADYINANSGLTPVEPGHVKAVLALHKDFLQSPEEATRRAEAKAAREQAKAEREQKAAKYAGLTDEQKKAVKKAERLAANAAKAKADMEALFNA